MNGRCPRLTVLTLPPHPPPEAQALLWKNSMKGKKEVQAKRGLSK